MTDDFNMGATIRCRLFQQFFRIPSFLPQIGPGDERLLLLHYIVESDVNIIFISKDACSYM